MPTLYSAIALARDAVLDYEILVDDLRRDVDADLERLRAAVRDRERAAEHLRQLIASAGANGVSELVEAM